jgi:prepilin peptidase CpaA
MTLSSFVSAVAILSFAGLVFSAAISDILRFQIPNRICLTVALLYPTYVLASAAPVDWLPALGVGALALAIGFVLFALGVFGAGDAKLFAATALWAGPSLIMPLIFYTTLAGGVVALFIWAQHRAAQAASLGMAIQTGVESSFAKQQMPYGSAIAVGALYVAFTLLRVN